MLAGDALPGESRETLQEQVSFDLQGIEYGHELFDAGLAAGGIASKGHVDSRQRSGLSSRIMFSLD